MEVKSINDIDYDFVVLSGGKGHPMTDAEKKLIVQSSIPILGICYGGQQVAKAFGIHNYHLKKKRTAMVEKLDGHDLAYNHEWGIDAGDLEKKGFVVTHKIMGVETDPTDKEKAKTKRESYKRKRIDLTLRAEYRSGRKFILTYQGHPEKSSTSA